MQQEIDRLAPWFHNLHLPGDFQTAPWSSFGDFPANKWAILQPHIPDDLTGWRVLDIGCNAGFYTFELARRGAHVTAIDLDPHYLAQAQWAASMYDLEDRITFRQMQIYDLAHMDATFDLVLFMGVFYHLRYPMLGLDIASQKATRLLVFQSLTMPGEEIVEETDGLSLFRDCDALHARGWPKMAFIEHRFQDDPTNWWIPNRAGVEAMLRSAGMQISERLDHEIYLCAPDPEHPSSAATWNAAEFLSATGRHTIEKG